MALGWGLCRFGVGRPADALLVNIRDTRWTGGVTPETIPLLLSGRDVGVAVVGGEVVYERGFFPRLGRSLEELWEEYSELGA